MKSKTTSTLILSAMFGTALSMSLADTKVEASTKPVYGDKTLQVNQILQFGSKGSQVSEIQGYLRAFDYYKGRQDGIYGVLTKQAVVTYQKKHDLIVDGIAGPQTIGHLLHASDVQINLTDHNEGITIKAEGNDPEKALTNTHTSSSIKGESKQILSQGDRGERVKKIQQLLAEFNYYDGIDGIYGAQTRAAVILFQQTHGLQADGVVGPETKAALTNKEKIVTAPEQKATNITSVQETKETAPKTKLAITETASSLKGTPYIWGGTSPVGFDCSGFIQYVFKQHGKSTPRTTQDLYQKGQNVSQLKPGDIVFFTTYKSGPSHAGIYLGNRTFIHAGSSTGVTTASLDQAYWSQRYIGAKRF